MDTTLRMEIMEGRKDAVNHERVRSGKVKVILKTQTIETMEDLS